MTIIYQKLNAPVTTLASPLGQDSLVRFISTSINRSPDREIENTNVNIHGGDRVLLCVAIYYKAGFVLLDSQTKAGTWDTREEKVPIANLFNELGATISIRSSENTYTLSADGKDFYTFQKRVKENVTGVSYRTVHDRPSVFSDPIIVETDAGS